MAQKTARPSLVVSPAAAEARASRFIDRVIELTNVERAKAGVAPVKREDSLTRAAHWMADDMATKNYFSHEDCKGRHIEPRLPDFGYKGYAMIGENIAGGQQSPEQVVVEWMRSPGHRANLLNPDFREIGVAYVHAPNSDLQDYWVQDFGTRRDVFPLIINNDVPQTKSPDVQIYAHGEKWAQQARYSSDGIHWTEWEPFQATRSWKLDATTGKQTIYMELSNGKDTRRATATIELNDINDQTHVASAR